MRPSPAGFSRREYEAGVAWLDSDRAPALVDAGLLAPWQLVSPTCRGPGTGRGPRGLIEIAGVGRVLVKQYMRGGWLARLNADRYLFFRRFVAELRVAVAASAAGCPVIVPLATVVRRSGWGWRAWQAIPWWEGSRDLAAWLTSPRRSDIRTGELFKTALRAIRTCHEGGLLHADLNLGNVLLRPVVGGQGWEARLIDLDRCRMFPGPVPVGSRRRALARLERSLVKHCPGATPNSKERLQLYRDCF